MTEPRKTPHFVKFLDLKNSILFLLVNAEVSQDHKTCSERTACPDVTGPYVWRPPSLGNAVTRKFCQLRSGGKKEILSFVTI